MAARRSDNAAIYFLVEFLGHAALRATITEADLARQDMPLLDGLYRRPCTRTRAG